jgi:hypothetical protein
MVARSSGLRPPKRNATPRSPQRDRNSRGDKTPLELFLVGIGALASQLPVTTKALVAILDSTCSELTALK